MKPAVWWVTVFLATGCGVPATRAITHVGTGRVLTNQPGLYVEQWRIESSDGRLDAAISELLPEEPIPLHGEMGFRHDGFRVALLSEVDIDALRAALTPAAPARRVQHGEALAWRDLLSRHVERRTVVLENGRMRRLPRGIIALAARGWSIPTVKGAGVHLQLVPHLVQQRVRPSSTATPGDLRGTPLAAAIEVTLPPATALLITSDSSLAATPDDAEEAPAHPSPTIGPVGPAAQLPPTVAELLLDEDNGRFRMVLILHGTPNPALLPLEPARP